jgi:hypothetical protein
LLALFAFPLAAKLLLDLECDRIGIYFVNRRNIMEDDGGIGTACRQEDPSSVFLDKWPKNRHLGHVIAAD